MPIFQPISFPKLLGEKNALSQVCLAKWWAHIGSVECSYSVTFHGIALADPQREITLMGAEGVARLELASMLHAEEVQPEIKLKTLVQNFRPHEARIAALGSRDVIPPNRQIYELQASDSHLFSL